MFAFSPARYPITTRSPPASCEVTAVVSDSDPRSMHPAVSARTASNPDLRIEGSLFDGEPRCSRYAGVLMYRAPRTGGTLRTTTHLCRRVVRTLHRFHPPETG